MASFEQQINNFQLEPTSVTSPMTAQGLGATADQTKMIGTDAHKSATISKRLESLGTSAQPQLQQLSRAERVLEVPREEMTVQEAQEKDAAEKMSKLGNLGLQVQNTINKSLAAAGKAPTGQALVQTTELAKSLGLSPEQVELDKADPNSNYNKISDSLNGFLNSGDPNDLEASMALMDNLKALGVSSADARRMVGLTQELIASQTGKTVAVNTMDQVTMAEIDLAELGFEGGMEQVAEVLGLTAEEISGMTIDEFGDMISDKQQAEFSRVAKMKAELAAAPVGSKQRDILLRELRDLGQVGITGIEAQVAENVEDIDLASTILVNGERIEVADFLADDNLSQLVEDWIAASPIEREKLIPAGQHPELVSWIQANQTALAKLSTTAGETKVVYDEAQRSNKTFNTIDDLDVSLDANVMKMAVPGWDPDKAITSKELAALKSTYNASDLGMVFSDASIPASDRKGIANSIGLLDKQDAANLLAKGKDEIVIAHSSAKLLEEEPALSDFLGIKSKNGFVLDDAQQDRINDYAPVIADIANGANAHQLANPVIKQQLKSLSPAELARANANPVLFNDIEEASRKATALDTARTPDEKISAILGSGVHSLQSINNDLASLQTYADLGERGAINQMNQYASMFGLPKFQRGVPMQLTESAINNAASSMRNVAGTAPSAIVSQGLNRDALNSASNALKSMQPYQKSPEVDRWVERVRDGKITNESMADLSTADKLKMMEWAHGTAGGVPLEITDWNGNVLKDKANAANFLMDKDALETVDRSLSEYGGSQGLYATLTKAAGSPDEAQTLQGLLGTMKANADTTTDPRLKKLYQDAMTDIRGTLGKWENAAAVATESARQARETSLAAFRRAQELGLDPTGDSIVGEY